MDSRWWVFIGYLVVFVVYLQLQFQIKRELHNKILISNSNYTIKDTISFYNYLSVRPYVSYVNKVPRYDATRLTTLIKYSHLIILFLILSLIMILAIMIGKYLYILLISIL